MEKSILSLPTTPFLNLVKGEETGSYDVTQDGLKPMILDVSDAGITSACYHTQLDTSHSEKPHFHGTWKVRVRVKGKRKVTVGYIGRVGEPHAVSTLFLICRLFPTHLLASLSSADMVEVTHSKCD